MIRWDEINHFQPDEFLHSELLAPTMAYMLDDLRRQFGKPLIVSSSWRDTDNNDRVGGVPTSSHMVNPETGLYSGVDLTTPSNYINSADRYHLQKIAMWVGFLRFGLYKKHIHLDIEARLPQERIWLG